MSAALAEAAASGERLTILRTLRDRLAGEMDGCRSARDLSSLSSRLLEVLAQIDELGGGVVPAKKETALDEFTKRLADRQSASSAARRTARR